MKINIKEIKITSHSYLTFELENELFAAKALNVLKIIELTKIIKVSKSSEYMLGVMNLRGALIPVVNLHLKFGLKIPEYSLNTCIIVMNIKIKDKPIMVGIIVDSALEVIEIEQINLLPFPNNDNKFKSEFIEGIILTEDKFIKVLNMEKVFSIEDIVTMDKQSLEA